jgi:hypothetical protein
MSYLIDKVKVHIAKVKDTILSIWPVLLLHLKHVLYTIQYFISPYMNNIDSGVT